MVFIARLVLQAGEKNARARVPRFQFPVPRLKRKTPRIPICEIRGVSVFFADPNPIPTENWKLETVF
jgi:hypothetical protein